MYSALSTLNTTTEVPLNKAPNPQLLPGRHSIGCPLLQVCVHGVCVFTAVCVHFGWVKCRYKYRSPYLAVCHVTCHYALCLASERISIRFRTNRLTLQNANLFIRDVTRSRGTRSREI